MEQALQPSFTGADAAHLFVRIPSGACRRGFSITVLGVHTYLICVCLGVPPWLVQGYLEGAPSSLRVDLSSTPSPRPTVREGGLGWSLGPGGSDEKGEG